MKGVLLVSESVVGTKGMSVCGMRCWRVCSPLALKMRLDPSSEWTSLDPVPSLSEGEGVLQEEGTVGHQERKASATVASIPWPSVENMSGMKGSEMVLPAGDTNREELTVGALDCIRGDGSCPSPSPLFICKMASGLRSQKSDSASSACMSSQLTH